MGSEAWARYGMNKARGIAQKQARFDTGEAEGREAARGIDQYLMGKTSLSRVLSESL